MYCAGFSFWILELNILIFRVSKYSKIFQIIVARAKKGPPPPSSLSVVNNVKECQRNIIILYLHVDLRNNPEKDSKRFRAQAFHRYMIQVIARYTEAFIGKLKKHSTPSEKVARLRESRYLQRLLIIPLP